MRVVWVQRSEPRPRRFCLRGGGKRPSPPPNGGREPKHNQAAVRAFDVALRAAGYITMGGQIVDTSLISAPKQRNTEAEKDRDARWTVKFSKAKQKPDGTM